MHLRHVHGSVRARGHATASSIRARLRRLRRRRVARVRDDDTMASCTWWWRRRRIALAAAMAMCARDVTPPRRPRARGRGGGGNQVQRGLTGERLRYEAAAADALARCAAWRSDALESGVGARVRARESVYACRRAPLAPQARRRAGRRAARAQSQRALAGFGAGLARERGIIVFQRWSRYAACRNTSRSWPRTSVPLLAAASLRHSSVPMRLLQKSFHRGHSRSSPRHSPRKGIRSAPHGKEQEVSCAGCRCAAVKTCRTLSNDK